MLAKAMKLIATRPRIAIRILEKLVKYLNKTTKDLKAATKQFVGKKIIWFLFIYNSAPFCMNGSPEGLRWVARSISQ